MRPLAMEVPRVPIVRLVAVGLTLLIGLSGLAAGLELLANLPASPSGPEWTAIAIGGGIAVYGIATIVGAVGTWRRSRVGWWIAVGAIAVGLAALVLVSRAGGGLDGMLLGGALFWAIALALLVGARPDARLEG
jgi:hypothetical protein